MFLILVYAEHLNIKPLKSLFTLLHRELIISRRHKVYKLLHGASQRRVRSNSASASANALASVEPVSRAGSRLAFYNGSTWRIEALSNEWPGLSAAALPPVAWLRERARVPQRASRPRSAPSPEQSAQFQDDAVQGTCKGIIST